MKKALLILASVLSLATGSFACSCFGPETFCATLNPPYEEPQWWIPDVVVLGIKTAEEAHGMDVEVLETIIGSVEAGDVLRVWGDCGILCRMYPGSWEIGDTVVWALKYTDLMGNGMCGNELEQEGEFMISICGTYFLDFDHGTVSGPIAEGVNELPYEAFVQMTSTCLAMAVPETGEEPSIDVSIGNGLLIAHSNSFQGGPIEHELIDAQGRLVRSGIANGDKVSIPIGDLATGVHLLRIGYGRHSEILRVLIP